MYEEKYQLKESELIALIQGKSLNFVVPGLYRIEILPPNHGVTVQYDDWVKIATFLRLASYPDCSHMDKLISKIEARE